MIDPCTRLKYELASRGHRSKGEILIFDARDPEAFVEATKLSEHGVSIGLRNTCL